LTYYFLDTSALVKRYVAESGSSWLHSIVVPTTGNTLFIAQITRAEITSTAARRKREGQISVRTAHAIRLIIDRHASREYRVVRLSEPVINRAQDLLETHSLRAYDSIQLASALEIQTHFSAAGLAPVTFVSADKQLLNAASAERLLTDNPESHP
jgi:uncharacterized protein